MKNVYTLKCTQLAPEYKENKEIIEYEDTLEKYESVTSEKYIRSRKRLTDRICSAALPDRLPYNYCIERDDKEQKGTVYMTSAFATKLNGCLNIMQVQDASLVLISIIAML